jgi:hypothetical protein
VISPATGSGASTTSFGGTDLELVLRQGARCPRLPACGELPTMPRAKNTSKKPSKSDFVRSQPASMSATEVVAAAKAKGISLTSALVYNVRGPKGRKGSATETSAKKTSTASKKVTPAKTPTNKADFVRARTHLSPKEIVEDAKTAGLKLAIGYVYSVRAGGKKGKGAAKKAVSKPASTTGARSSTSKLEDLLRAAGAELGLARAIEILQGERARVRAVIGG